MTAATPACTRDPNSAWYTPPENSSGSTPRNECVHQSIWTTACQPRAITTPSSHTSGTNAMRNEVKKSVVAMLFLIRRHGLSGRNTTSLTGISSAAGLIWVIGGSSVHLSTGDRAGGGVDQERQHKQRKARRDIGTSRQRLAEFRSGRSDFGGKRVAAVEYRPTARLGGRTQDDQHRHGFAQCTTQSQHRGGHDPASAEWQHGHPHHFPFGRTERLCRFDLRERGLAEHFPGYRGDDRQDHHGQHDARREDRAATGQRDVALGERTPT